MTYATNHSHKFITNHYIFYRNSLNQHFCDLYFIPEIPELADVHAVLKRHNQALTRYYIYMNFISTFIVNISYFI